MILIDLQREAQSLSIAQVRAGVALNTKHSESALYVELHIMDVQNIAVNHAVTFHNARTFAVVVNQKSQCIQPVQSAKYIQLVNNHVLLQSAKSVTVIFNHCPINVFAAKSAQIDFIVGNGKTE